MGEKGLAGNIRKASLEKVFELSNVKAVGLCMHALPARTFAHAPMHRHIQPTRCCLNP